MRIDHRIGENNYYSDEEGRGDDAIIAVAEGQRLIAFVGLLCVASAAGLFLAGVCVGLLF